MMCLKSFLKKRIKILYQKKLDEHETSIVNSVLENENFDKVINSRPRQVSKIGFIFGSVQLHSGGHTSILRLGSGLSNLGYDVSYVSFQNQDIKSMKANAFNNYNAVKGKFYSLKSTNVDMFDIIIATSWQSVYYAKKFNAYKMYFVQDFEPYFFKLNERYLLAKKTYELGFHIVSLGKWNIEQIRKHCAINNCKIDYIAFPYEPDEYKEQAKRNYLAYANKKNIKIACYTKEDGKRIPNLIQSILKKASTELRKDGIELEIFFFGFDSSTKVTIGKNLGKLNKEEMNSLFNKCDFGLVASMTNISLVPYEMMATGLPVIEFEDGSFPFFFGNGSSILIDYNFMTLVSKLEDVLQNPEKLKTMANNSKNRIKNLTWKSSCEEFSQILQTLKDE